MEVFNDKEKQGNVIALGNFDGLHIAHQAVIEAAVNMAENMQAQPCVLMFSAHSLKLLLGQAPSKLMSGEQRERLLQDTGAKTIYIDFQDIKDMSARQFFTDILVGRLHAKGLCCGFNYHFGKNAQGTTQTLGDLCAEYGIELFVASPVEYKGELVSSTRIRKALIDGNIIDVNNMLGRAFSYKEVVIDGDKRGRLLGTPTINQVIDDTMTVPKHGVYASATMIEGVYHASVTNIGIRPTIGTGVLGSETYILDFSGDLYGQSIEISLLEYLREEQKFENLEALCRQIQKDAQNAKKFFEEGFKWK